ncbi:MAG: PucR family transcriptional regulator ligand-binding domain-containing protein, partial [Bacillota bacterium]|nr:PucR family transcriptional regulator ligand-binding domain-containing protein [Bacillota bacterium]
MLINNRITMAEVLETEDFRDAEIIAGSNGLNKEVSWIHVLETWDDSNKWIDGCELILCSAVGVKDPQEL